MRLIDADRLLDIMKQERDRISDTYGENDEYVRCLNTYAISMVLNAPTIEERKTGRWIEGEQITTGKVKIQYKKCSRCEEESIYTIKFDDYEIEIINDHCPNCGCKMKVEQSLSEADNDTTYGGLMSAT